MKNLILLFLGMNIVLPLLVISHSSIKKKLVEINHITLFSVGYLYYFVLPIFIGINSFFSSKSSMQMWYIIFDNITEINLLQYLIIILLMYSSFILGAYKIEFNKNKLIQRNKLKKNLYFSNSILNIFIMFLIIILMYFIFKLKSLFFTGYTNSANFNGFQKGSFVAFSLVIFCFMLIYSNKTSQAINQFDKNKNFYQILNNKFLYLYLFTSFLVLSMGGRLYFASGMISILVYKSVYFSRIKLKNLLIAIISFALLMGFIGVYRSVGNGEIDFSDIVFNLFQEPIFTSFSLIKFIQDGHFDLLNSPKFLTSHFINLVPTALFPNKLDYILLPEMYGYFIYNPIGAFSLFVSLIINFGILGSAIFLYFFGNIMGRIKYRVNSILSKTIYVMISGFIIFTFFRDGFETSLIKNILEFSIIIPIIIILLSSLVSEVFRKNN